MATTLVYLSPQVVRWRTTRRCLSLRVIPMMLDWSPDEVGRPMFLNPLVSLLVSLFVSWSSPVELDLARFFL